MTVTAIAHRGEPVGHRENTLPAFEAAVALGADMVEIDLRRTRDGAIVVLHDQTLERLWGRAASVGDAFQVLAGMSGLHGLQSDAAVMNSLKFSSSVFTWVGYITAGFFCVWAMPNSNEILARYERAFLPPALEGLFYAALICVIVVGASGPPVQFLYFQF